MPVAPKVTIPLHEIELRISRSSGPGGQHANVTASRVVAVFELARSRSLSATQKARIEARLGPSPSAVAQDTRSQAQTRELALQRLQERLTQALIVPRKRAATKPSRAARERRLTAKRQAGERKRQRQRPSSED